MLDYQPNSWLWEDDAILSPCLFLYTLTHTVTLIPCFVVRSQRNRVRDLEESIVCLISVGSAAAPTRMRPDGMPPRRPLARRRAAPGGHPACAPQDGAARAHIRH